MEVRDTNLTYVRISAFSALSSAIEMAVAAATRALERYPNRLVRHVAVGLMARESYIICHSWTRANFPFSPFLLRWFNSLLILARGIDLNR